MLIYYIRISCSINTTTTTNNNTATNNNNNKYNITIKLTNGTCICSYYGKK